ncbi:hypothetical protein Syun_009922 [Stephania yunnanensis]|uniref:Uncharacterized protein n=1 Tax=Stephania yunnanensis TaxID=152371 RepID=A0AAP0PP48_9MAGN
MQPGPSPESHWSTPNLERASQEVVDRTQPHPVQTHVQPPWCPHLSHKLAQLSSARNNDISKAPIFIISLTQALDLHKENMIDDNGGEARLLHMNDCLHKYGFFNSLISIKAFFAYSASSAQTDLSSL